MTFRMRGHEEASGTKYIPAELFTMWGERDPVICYENWLVGSGITDKENMQGIRNDFRSIIESAIAIHDHPVVVDTKIEMEDVYAKDIFRIRFRY